LKELKFKLNKTEICIVVCASKLTAANFSAITKKNYKRIFQIDDVDDAYFPSSFHEKFEKYEKALESNDDDNAEDELGKIRNKVLGQYAEIGQIGFAIESDSNLLNINKYIRNGNDRSRNGYDGILVDTKNKSLHFLESKATFETPENIGKINTKFLKLMNNSINTLYSMKNEKSEVNNERNISLDAKAIMNRIYIFSHIKDRLSKIGVDNEKIIALELDNIKHNQQLLKSGENDFLDIENQVHGLFLFVENSTTDVYAVQEQLKEIIIEKFYSKKRLAKELKYLFDRISNDKVKKIQINLILLNDKHESVIDEGLSMTKDRNWWNG
jgi:uncharacterized protein YjaZ